MVIDQEDHSRIKVDGITDREDQDMEDLHVVMHHGNKTVLLQEVKNVLLSLFYSLPSA